jgi:DNA end-binding protein Ku
MATTKTKPRAKKKTGGSAKKQGSGSAKSPRSLRNATITLGALAVPVKLHTATESKTVHFHEVHAADGARIEHRRFCTKEDKEVPYEEVVRGYQLSARKYVVMDKDEVAAAAGDHGRRIDLEDVVDVTQIDPVFFEKTYYLGPGDGGEDGYKVLHKALQKTRRAIIGRYAFHGREYLAAVRAGDDGVLLLHNLRFHDEVVSGDDLDPPESRKKPTRRETEMAKQLVESLGGKFRAERYEDEYREAVLELIDAKAKGKEVDLPEPEEIEETDDLLAALKASLKGARR